MAVTLASGAFILGYPNATTPDLYYKADNATDAATIWWPTGSLSSYGIGALSIGTGGAVIQVHNFGTSSLIRGVSSGTVITTSIEAYDATPNYPEYMYYFGE